MKGYVVKKYFTFGGRYAGGYAGVTGVGEDLLYIKVRSNGGLFINLRVLWLAFGAGFARQAE